MYRKDNVKWEIKWEGGEREEGCGSERERERSSLGGSESFDSKEMVSKIKSYWVQAVRQQFLIKHPTLWGGIDLFFSALNALQFPNDI